MHNFNWNMFLSTLFVWVSLLCAFVGFISMIAYLSLVPCLWFIPGILCISINSALEQPMYTKERYNERNW